MNWSSTSPRTETGLPLVELAWSSERTRHASCVVGTEGEWRAGGEGAHWQERELREQGVHDAWAEIREMAVEDRTAACTHALKCGCGCSRSRVRCCLSLEA